MKNTVQNRERWPLLSIGFLLACTSVFSQCGFAQESESPFEKTTFIFKSVGKLKLKADVYHFKNDRPRPVIVWLHGGALIMGSREGVPGQLLKLAESKHYVVVSLDYRLAPQVKLDQIIDDLSDGLKWIRKSGPKLFGADPSRFVVAGASAGGYLALMSGIIAEPRPSAIVSYWGFGDIDGDWTTQPSEYYRKGKLLTREEAHAGMDDTVLLKTDKDTVQARSKYFLYLKQTGRWVNEVSGLDPVKDRQKLTRYCPVRNVTPDFPHTLFLHGTADKDVPVGQTIQMAAELKRHGVANEVITIEGGGHSLWGGDRKKIDGAFKRSMQFIDEQLSNSEK